MNDDSKTRAGSERESAGKQRDAEAREVFERLLDLKSELPDPNALIDLAAARQLQEIGRIEAMVARRAERDATVAEVVRAGQSERIALRRQRAESARSRADLTADLAKIFVGQPDEQTPHDKSAR